MTAPNLLPLPPDPGVIKPPNVLFSVLWVLYRAAEIFPAWALVKIFHRLFRAGHPWKKNAPTWWSWTISGSPTMRNYCRILWVYVSVIGAAFVGSYFSR